MKILHVFGCMDKGGAELRTYEVSKFTFSTDYHHDFCSLSGRVGLLDNDIKLLGGSIFYLRIYSLKFLFQFIFLLRKNQYDVVHSHVFHSSGYILFLARLAGVKGRIAHFRSSGEQVSNGIASKLVKKLKKILIDTFSTDILAVSESTLSLAWEVNWRKDSRCRVVYTGIEICGVNSEINRKKIIQELLLPQNSHIYIHVGRFAKPKNHIKLLEIFKEISCMHPEAVLLLVGRGGTQIESKVKDYICEEKLEKKVTLVGESSNVRRLLSVADVLIFPSLWEGLPGVVLESISVGTPVLASDIPIISELSPHFEGILHKMKISEDSQNWATFAYNIKKDTDKKSYRTDAVRVFNNSVFKLDVSAAMHCTVWDKYKND